MNQQESNICSICGGVKRVDWTISFEECHPVEVRFDPVSLAENWRLCPGHPEPAPKHDGKLDEKGDVEVSYGQVYVGMDEKGKLLHVNGIHLADMDESVHMRPQQALSLLAWLRQEESELLRMAKEQGG